MYYKTIPDDTIFFKKRSKWMLQVSIACSFFIQSHKTRGIPAYK